MDKYKVDLLKNTLEQMRNDEYFIPKIRLVNDRYINLDEDAVKMLIDYYENPKQELKKIVHVSAYGNTNKYILTKVYKDFGIYEHKSPSGYYINQDWLVYNGTIGFISEPYNNMCFEELTIAIDRYKEKGKFGFHGFKTYLDGIYVVHPNNRTYSF